MHQQYGDVVRIGADRLSYTNPQAWKDIFGHRAGGRKENGKDSRFIMPEHNGEYHMLTTKNVEEHARLRKIFSNAFSDKALKLQEPLIQRHVDKLLDIFTKITEGGQDAPFNIVKLFNCITFDIMGDLTFGESLGMLDTGEYTPWVKSMFLSIRYRMYFRLSLEYPMLGRLMTMLAPSGFREDALNHFQYSAERVDRRLKKGSDHKPDIWSLVLNKGEEQISVPKMHANASLFMVAGTETTATLLSGLTFYLLKNPDKMRKVVKEVRGLTKDQLSLEYLPRLPYLNACFEEAFRLFPPVPVGLPRETPKGGNAICGEWVPERVRV